MSPVILALKKQIGDAQEAIVAYQVDCSHEFGSVTIKYKSDTDDYDRPMGKIKYWKECHCSWCGKRWEEPQ